MFLVPRNLFSHVPFRTTKSAKTKMKTTWSFSSRFFFVCVCCFFGEGVCLCGVLKKMECVCCFFVQRVFFGFGWGKNTWYDEMCLFWSNFGRYNLI